MITSSHSIGRRWSVLGRGILPTLAVLACAACGSQLAGNTGGSNTGGGGTGGGGTGGGGTATTTSTQAPVTISAYDAGDAPFIGDPGAGMAFVVLQVTLHNVSASGPIPTSYGDYAVNTASGLSISGAYASTSLPSSCPTQTSVLPGGQITCSVAFSVPTSDAVQAVVYDDHKGDTATAPISPGPLPSVAACSSLAGSANIQAQACTDCLDMASNAACNPQYQELEKEKVNMCPSAMNLCNSCFATGNKPDCDCEANCLGSCVSAFEAVYQCLLTQCGSACQ